MDKIKNTIKELALRYKDEIIAIRRHIHMNPELSFNEKLTSEFISSKLDEYKISYKTGYAGYGILGIIEGTSGNNTQSKIIALRADMDALPLNEQNEIEYKSVNQGVMHACGHDVHTASLLGTAKILSEIKDQFSGIILLIFQPGEERIPGGAKKMMDDGIFSQYIPDIIIGQHVMPSMNTGTVGFRPGKYMASSDEIYLTIKGKGGHAALPHEINDTVLIASLIVVALQQIVSRNAKSTIPTVLSFGKLIANGAVNIIPDEVTIEGTFRTMDEDWRSEAGDKIKKIATSIAESMGATCEVEIRKGYPFLINDTHITERAIEIANDFFEKENVIDMEIRMTAEDFAYFSHKYPSCFYRLGTGNGNQNSSPLHSTKFNINEDALMHGSGFMAWLAFSFLTNKN